MAYSYLLGKEIRAEDLSPCYVLYGEETYLADQFVAEITSVLLSPDGEPLPLERFDLSENRWAEILDVARTVPLFFAPWRVLLVTGREETKKKPDASEEKKDAKKKADSEDRMIREYCSSPPERTVLLVVIPGRVTRTSPQVKPFASLPAGVVLKEMAPLKRKDLARWVEAAFRPARKTVTAEARQRLIEIVGNDLRLLDNEIKKLITYAADRRAIDVEDVEEVCDWGREFAVWELVSTLERIDPAGSQKVLAHLFRDGAAAEYVLGALAGLFRDALLARLWLKEGQGRQEIFQTLRPKVREFFDDYERIFRGFFELAEDTTNDVLVWAMDELGRIDVLIKSSDVPAEAMISGFLIDYCRRRRPKTVGPSTSGKRG